MNDNIKINGWGKLFFGVILSGIVAVNAYAYYVVFPKTLDSVVENDRLSRSRDSELKGMIIDNKLLIVEFQSVKTELNIFKDAMKDDMSEIKSILRRTAPYERK